MHFVTLTEWNSNKPIAVNADRVVTIESTGHQPPACRLAGGVLVKGTIEEIVQLFNRSTDGKEGQSAFAKAVKRHEKKSTKRASKRVSKSPKA